MNNDYRVFKDLDRRKEFWEKIRAVIDEYPEILKRFDEVFEYEAHDDADLLNRGKEYDPESPKYIHGFVLLLNIMNLDRDEMCCTLTPFDQPRMVTRGMISQSL